MPAGRFGGTRSDGASRTRWETGPKSPYGRLTRTPVTAESIGTGRPATRICCGLYAGSVHWPTDRGRLRDRPGTELPRWKRAPLRRLPALRPADARARPSPGRSPRSPQQPRERLGAHWPGRLGRALETRHVRSQSAGSLAQVPDFNSHVLHLASELGQLPDYVPAAVPHLVSEVAQMPLRVSSWPSSHRGVEKTPAPLLMQVGNASGAVC